MGLGKSSVAAAIVTYMNDRRYALARALALTLVLDLALTPSPVAPPPLFTI